jgi:hypothetical protein
MIKYTNKYTDKSFDIAKCRESALLIYHVSTIFIKLR